jgi:hypothetical protein
MAIEDGLGHSPSWFTAPGSTDTLAWVALVLICLGLYGLVTLYAAFDRWAEHKSKGTPLAKTIPTLLAIALLYEIFPLDHFHVLLPVSAILLALMADWSRFHVPVIREVVAEPTASPAVASAAAVDAEAVRPAQTEDVRNA